MHSVNIFQDMFYRTQRKCTAFIHRAKGTPVPGAISGYSDKQTARLAGRTDRPLLKTSVLFLLCNRYLHSHSLLFLIKTHFHYKAQFVEKQ
jgi:hypothetical protein